MELGHVDSLSAFDKQAKELVRQMNEYNSMKLNFIAKPPGKTCIVVKELEMLC